MSIIAMSIMGLLFLCETYAFASTSITTAIAVDDNADQQIRLNFNISMIDLHCDYVSVDVWDALGTNRQNVTKNVDKWQLDSEGNKRIFSGRNRESRELAYDIEAEEGEEYDGHAIALTKDTFDSFLKQHEMAFIDLYAPWYVLVVGILDLCMNFHFVCFLLQVCVVPTVDSYMGEICPYGKGRKNAHWCRKG
jgi:Endoplasmic Reticulum-Golgi Intermediate Compartment (ERGIC)